MTSLSDQPDLTQDGHEGPRMDSADAELRAEHEPQPPVILVGRLVSIRYLFSVLKRRRRIWVTLAALGLLGGLAFHVAVPRSYSATTTLYLAHAPNTNDDVDMANDLALVQTTTVAQRAIKALGESSLTPEELLGKEPATQQSDNVLTLQVSGKSKSEATKRANALATAFLTFRADRYQAQNQAADAALNSQIDALQQQIHQITSKISSLGPSAQGEELTSLVSEQSSDTNQVATLEQTIQQNQVAAITVASGSRVLTPGTPVPASSKKLYGEGALSGLIFGLLVGAGYVIVQAVISDRVRRRDEVASLLGAPVELSIGRFRHPRKIEPKFIQRMTTKPDQQTGVLADYIRKCGIPNGDKTTLLVVAADDVALPAAAVALLASRLKNEGISVLVADLTGTGELEKAFDSLEIDTTSRFEARAREGAFQTSGINRITDPDPIWLSPGNGVKAVIALAVLDPGIGAWHLEWARESIVTVSAGRSSAQHVNATAALLRVAGVPVRSGVLLDADPDDESVGLLSSGMPLVGLPLGVTTTSTLLP
jgi:capsular polysaccharide biosynthesis protein